MAHRDQQPTLNNCLPITGSSLQQTSVISTTPTRTNTTTPSIDDPLYLYDDAVTIAANGIGDSCTSVQVDALCSTSNASANLRDAVVMILLDDEGSTCSGMLWWGTLSHRVPTHPPSLLKTGTLINAPSGRPTVLTAFHCLQDMLLSASVPDASVPLPFNDTDPNGEYVNDPYIFTETLTSKFFFAFNFQRACTNSSASSTLSRFQGVQLLQGAIPLYGNAATDIMVLELLDDIPTVFTPYYMGWSSYADDVPSSLMVVHHPNGDMKKISVVKYVCWGVFLSVLCSCVDPVVIIIITVIVSVIHIIFHHPPPSSITTIIPSPAPPLPHPHSNAPKTVSSKDITIAVEAKGEGNYFLVPSWDSGTMEPGSSGSALVDANNMTVVGTLTGTPTRSACSRSVPTVFAKLSTVCCVCLHGKYIEMGVLMYIELGGAWYITTVLFGCIIIVMCTSRLSDDCPTHHIPPHHTLHTPRHGSCMVSGKPWAEMAPTAQCACRGCVPTLVGCSYRWHLMSSMSRTGVVHLVQSS